jgi:hypothetical protein
MNEKKLRAEARKIQELIDKGDMSEEDLPLLVMEGLSQETVDYWNDYWKNDIKQQKENNTMDTTQQLIDKLTSAISFKFKEDGIKPNLTISRLPRSFYCSIVRFPKGAPANKAKVVICKAESDNLDVALKSVAEAFLVYANPQPDPIQQLAAISKKNG